MTHDEARKLCDTIPQIAYTRDVGMGRTAVPEFADHLKSQFPGHNWRIILDRSGEYSRWRLTVDDEDPREHYFSHLGGQCVHCGKSAREIARIDEVNGDEEFLSELEEIHALS